MLLRRDLTNVQEPMETYDIIDTETQVVLPGYQPTSLTIHKSLSQACYSKDSRNCFSQKDRGKGRNRTINGCSQSSTSNRETVFHEHQKVYPHEGGETLQKTLLSDILPLI